MEADASTFDIGVDVDTPDIVEGSHAAADFVEGCNVAAVGDEEGSNCVIVGITGAVIGIFGAIAAAGILDGAIATLQYDSSFSATESGFLIILFVKTENDMDTNIFVKQFLSVFLHERIVTVRGCFDKKICQWRGGPSTQQYLCPSLLLRLKFLIIFMLSLTRLSF